MSAGGFSAAASDSSPKIAGARRSTSWSRHSFMTASAGLCNLVLVVREHEIEPTTVDQELGPECLLRHGRALDVPPRAPATPGGVPPRVLVRLVRLPEGEVARVFFQQVRFLLLHL